MMKEFYCDRIKAGWSMTEIDECDFLYWLDLLAYMVKEQNEKKSVTIDKVF